MQLLSNLQVAGCENSFFQGNLVEDRNIKYGEGIAALLWSPQLFTHGRKREEIELSVNSDTTILEGVYEMHRACLIRVDENSSAEIKALIFTGMLTKHDLSSDSKFSLVDQVWLTMKLLFEEQGFTITENGLIIATES